MADSIVIFPNIGSSQSSFSFSFDYIAATDIDAFVEGVSVFTNNASTGTAVGGNTYTIAFSSGGSKTLTFSPAVPQGSTVRIERNTALTTKAVDFSDGAVLTEVALDSAIDQLFFATQESNDKTNESVKVTPDGKFDALSKVIKNVGTPTDANDATTKSYVDTSANNAASSAAAALVSQNASAASATASAGSATTSANEATDSANSATASAASASTATTQAALATSNGAAQVALATSQAALATTNGAAQVALATTQADNAASSATTAATQATLATTNGAAQVALATTQADLATTNGAAQVALATTQADLATTNGAAQVALATTQANLATTNGAVQVALATTQANNAASSASTAATQATASASSASTSATQATNSANSATASANSATSASSAQTAAESARDATLAAYDNFDDRYLGAKSSSPTVDNDGNALIAGSLFFDTVNEAMKIYTGSAWVAAYVTGADFIPTSGGGITGDLAFGDNDKAIFGADNDLQVYHDGSHSYVSDAGTGNLQLSTNGTAIKMLRGNGEVLSSFNIGGSVDLYHSNAKKFETTASGIDVTGGIDFSSGILASNGSVQFVMDKDNNGGEVFAWGHNASNATTNELMRLTSAGSLGIGTASPNVELEISGVSEMLRLQSTDTNKAWVAGYGSGTSARWLLGSNASNDSVTLQASNSTGELLFKTGGANERLRISSSGSVGINTTTMNAGLNIKQSADNAYQLKLEQHNATDGYGLICDMSDGDLAFSRYASSAYTERMRLTVAGSLGIGTASPSQKLTVEGTANNQNSEIKITASGVASGYLGSNSNGLNIGTDSYNIVFKTGVTGGGSVGATGSEKVRITTAGDVGIGRSDPQNIVGNHGGGLVVRSAAGRAATTTLFAVQSSNSYNMIEHLHNGQFKLRNSSNTQTLLVDTSGNATFSGSVSAAGGFVGAGGLPPTIQIFTSSGTWTKPTGCKKIKVTVQGGGGGAGGCTSQGGDHVSQGGGAGGAAIEYIDVTSVTSVSVTRGAGGGGGNGSGGNGASGGTSSFGSYCSASGGSGGIARGGNAGTDNAIQGANCGIGSGGIINIKGTRGGSRQGGIGIFQGGAANLIGNGNGEAGLHGSGGGPASSSGYDSNRRGGAGGAGLVMVEEYY